MSTRKKCGCSFICQHVGGSFFFEPEFQVTPTPGAQNIAFVHFEKLQLAHIRFRWFYFYFIFLASYAPAQACFELNHLIWRYLP